jgi:hypothetical protein
MARTIRINGVDVPVIADQLSGEEIKRLAGIGEERVVVRQEPDRNTIVPDTQRIRVADGDVFTHHARHTKAAVTTPRSRRLRTEAAQLAGGYPGLTVADDDTWIVIDGFRLPAGWVPDRTRVMLTPPPNYPQAGPDGFYLAARLRRRTGTCLTTPGHYFATYHNPYAQLGWWWYCLQDPERNWDPRLDSLVTFVEAIRTYLGTGD